ncbi:head protein [Myxococcaceae bacterium GXIMD 01537]
MNINELCLDVEGFLGRLREDALSSEDQEKFLLAIDALRFIASSGQLYELEDYRKGLETHAPPPIVAAFATVEEAEGWLRNHPKPPQHAFVLVGARYYSAMHFREIEARKLVPSMALERYLAEMARKLPQTPVASFSTREEANAWLVQQPSPLAPSVLLIDGRHYLGVQHPYVGVRAIYPLAAPTPE